MGGPNKQPPPNAANGRRNKKQYHWYVAAGILYRANAQSSISPHCHKPVNATCFRKGHFAYCEECHYNIYAHEGCCIHRNRDGFNQVARDRIRDRTVEPLETHAPADVGKAGSAKESNPSSETETDQAKPSRKDKKQKKYLDKQNKHFSKHR